MKSENFLESLILEGTRDWAKNEFENVIYQVEVAQPADPGPQLVLESILELLLRFEPVGLNHEGLSAFDHGHGHDHSNILQKFQIVMYRGQFCAFVMFW